MSTALALASGLGSTDALALTLGRLNVQSALGEPFRAEVDVPNITAAEADSLKVSIGTPESFRTAGVPYSAALSDVHASLQRRADGRYVVRLNGSRSTNDPFIDLLLEANWSSGRIVKDYTVLLDPPAARPAAAPVNPPIALQASPAPLPPPVVAAAPSPMVPATGKERPASSSRTEAAAVRASAGAGAGASEKVTVQRGDTASKIAATYKPADVSLDQMLVALVHGNPNAFIGGNVNRMKFGAVLTLPSNAQTRVATPEEASRTIKAQSDDFDGYRRRLAENAPASRTGGTERQASGKLQASVEERNASASSPDKLKISQGNAATTTADDKLVQNRQAQETSNRATEVAKNLDDLKKLQAASEVATVPTASASEPIAAPAALVAAAPVAPVVSVTPAPATTPALASTPKPGFIAALLDSPLMLGATALIAALIAFLLYSVLKARRPDDADSVFNESGRPRDTFFNVTPSEQPDASDRNSPAVSSLVYSHSQLDASDVDPVAEADVYLAYGRDLQAEEILREAMRAHPERIAIPLKLLEIHAKRRDLRAFETLTTDVHQLTGGTGPEWTRAIGMGHELDPDNALYQTKSAPTEPPAVLPLVPSPSVLPLDFEDNIDIHALSPSRPEVFDADFFHLETADVGEHPHAMKLSLARELTALGDTEGARSLIQEVASEGSVELQAKARQLLTQLAS